MQKKETAGVEAT